MTVESQKARRLDGEEREQPLKYSGFPTDTVLGPVFKSGRLRGCIQMIRLQLEFPPELLSIKLCSQRKHS